MKFIASYNMYEEVTELMYITTRISKPFDYSCTMEDVMDWVKIIDKNKTDPKASDVTITHYSD